MVSGLFQNFVDIIYNSVLQKSMLRAVKPQAVDKKKL